MRALPYLLLLAWLVVLPACTGGRGAPRIGQRDLPPTRTIAGERVELERYGGAWAPVAETAPGDRATMDLVWSTLEKAGIPATAVAFGSMQRVKVPGPHARQARRLLRPLQGDGPAGTRLRVVER